jgi:Asp-tRNA(Asn)/Glu-tRNA(Gln) amidotransferase A subunit family amidase
MKFDFNSVYNATGLPAITLPLHQSRDGLPIGMMLGARFGNESLLFQLAGQRRALGGPTPSRQLLGRPPATKPRRTEDDEVPEPL